LVVCLLTFIGGPVAFALGWPLISAFWYEGLPLMNWLPADCLLVLFYLFLCWRYLSYFCCELMLHGGIAARLISSCSSGCGLDAWWFRAGECFL